MSQFPRYNRFGKLTVEEPRFWQRKWLDDTRLIWHNGVNTLIDGQPVGPSYNRLGAGGGKWRGSTLDHADPEYSFSGRHAWVENPQSNDKRLYVDDVSEPIAIGKIIEMRVSDTCLTWKQDDDVWAYANGEKKLIATTAGWPVAVDTPDGPWIAMMRGGGVWLCPFADPSSGLAFDAKGQSFYPDAVCLGLRINMAWTDLAGRVIEVPFSIRESRMPWADAPPVIVLPPPVISPNPEPPPVSTPNHRHIVEQVAAQFPHLLQKNTRAAAGEFTERAVLALAAVDANWGHVGKRQPQTQWNGHAEDAVMYKATQQVVDILYLAGAAELPPEHHDFGKPALVAWDHKDNGGQPWMAPIPVAGEPAPSPTPTPTPVPPAPTPTQPPADDDDIEAFFDLMIEEQINTNDHLAEISTDTEEMKKSLAEIRSEIAGLRVDLKQALPEILKVLGKIGLGGLLGGGK